MRKQKAHTISDIMQGFRLGKQWAFDELFHQLYPALCYYGGKITGDRAASEDIAGESLLKVWDRHAQFEHFGVLKSFLYTTVRNASFNWLKQYGKRVQSFNESVEITDTEQNRFDQLVMAETYRELHTAINQLPAQCRKVISLSFLEGKNGREVAAALNMEPNTVRSHKNRGILLLKKRLRYFLPSLLLIFIL